MGLTSKDQSYDLIERNLGTIPHPTSRQETDISIAEFLKRPLLIATVDMAVGGTVTPWATFLTNPAVAAKIRNAYLIRGNMHMRFIPQADMYTYGMATVTPTIHGKVCDPYASDYGAMIDVGSQKEMELKTPYFGETPFIVVPNAAAATQFSYQISAVVGPYSTNSAVAPPVTFSVYCWITDLDIRVPYAQSVKQAVRWVDDTFGNNDAFEDTPSGLISKPMSALNKAGNILGDVPFIGSIAKTAGSIAGAIGKVASFFGFSRPLNNLDATQVIIRQNTNMAATAGLDYSINVSSDPKRSKTLDPTTAIGMGYDQLSFGYISRHWGYIDVSTFATTNNVGDTLDSYWVYPGMCPLSGSGLRMTPMASVALMFKYWTGSLEFKFVVIASPFHKGRVRIFWNPQAATENPTNTTTMITLDITPGNTGTLVVPWGSELPYRPCGVGELGPIGTPNGMSNGFVYVQVDQKLQCPTLTSSAYLLTFVRAGEDMDWNVVSGTTLNTYHRTARPAGGSIARTVPTLSVAYPAGAVVLPVINQSIREPVAWGVSNASTVDLVGKDIPLEIFGEKVTTFRALLKKSYFSGIYTIPSGTSINGIRFRRLPVAPEYDGTHTPLMSPTLLNYVGDSFIFNSGSTRVKLCPQISQSELYFRLVRDHGAPLTTSYTSGTAPTMNTTAFMAAPYQAGGGTIVRSTQGLGNLIEFEIPDYSGLRMQVNEFDMYAADSAVTMFRERWGTAGVADNYICHYTIGEDFNFYAYAGPPVAYFWNWEAPPV